MPEISGSPLARLPGSHLVAVQGRVTWTLSGAEVGDVPGQNHHPMHEGRGGDPPLRPAWALRELAQPGSLGRGVPHCDGGKELAVSFYIRQTLRSRCARTPVRGLAQLQDHVGVEKVHHSNAAGRRRSARERRASSSILEVPGRTSRYCSVDRSAADSAGGS